MSSQSGGANSIFSSSNHSSRSLTTTLTTIQSTAPSNHLAQPGGTLNTGGGSSNHAHHASQGSTYFSHQYPTTPASAVPAHVQTQANSTPTTYRTATANNLLTDNASILTLASSSHNLRARNSLDTDASIRALAPSSQWGGSRESLPLSTLSQSNEAQPPGTIPPTSNTGGVYYSGQRPSIATFASAERASVYSSQGVNAPALSSERNSIYAGRPGRQENDASSLKATDGGSLKATDGGSVKATDGNSVKATDGGSLKAMDASSLKATDAASTRSGLGHGRNDSLAGSVGPSPLASPREGTTGSAGD